MNKKIKWALALIALILVMSVPALAAANDTGFTDVNENAWYAEAVAYCLDHGLMTGTAETAFEPNTPISRGMLAEILYREADSPSVNQEAGFSDVAANAWYSEAVSWASENGVISGYGNERFGPSDPVTREQIAAILWRSEGSPAISGSQSGAVKSFADQDSISAYAANAVSWTQQNGIVSGKENNRFDPKGTATRAETAVILFHFLNRSQGNQPDTASGTAITLTVGDTVIPAVLEDSASTRDLISRLPFTVSMTRGSADYYAQLASPLKYDEADVHNGWKNGDIGFDSGGNYLTVFHAGEESSQQHGNQITLGKISGDLAALRALGGSIEVKIALAGSDTAKPGASRTLIVYYSHSQRTESVAKELQKKSDGDLYQLIPANPYSGSDSEIAARAKQEIESGSLPAFSGTLPDLADYDTILVGGPVWSYTVSSPILSYLEKADFTGKTVAPFWTDQGGAGAYETDFSEAVQGGRVTPALGLSHVTSLSESELSQTLDTWLSTISADR